MAKERIDLYKLLFNRSDFHSRDEKELRSLLRKALHFASLKDIADREELELLYYQKKLACDDFIRLSVSKKYEQLFMEIVQGGIYQSINAYSCRDLLLAT
ncbi:hypothetical protein L4C54_19620 [Vibrio lamellibrachiae]|uniref:hypothetical protein n=1 Tax=Vibrio lamellibrachiae TaxID=2910253 RepID=UPI003D14CB14